MSEVIKGGNLNNVFVDWIKPKYNPLPLLLYAHSLTPDIFCNRGKIKYLEGRLLELGHCTSCSNTGYVTIYSCSKPLSTGCCGGCEETVECDNCK